MNKEPLVTVIIPCYNHENYIEECLKSVVLQTYKNIELIILNDGSRDKSAEKILNLMDECKNRFVRFEFIDKLNEGVSKTLNQGIQWSMGKYISPLSSDDLIFPDKIEKLVELFEESNEKVGMICGDAIFINETSTKYEMLGKYKRFLDFSLCNRENEKEIIINEKEITYLMMLKGNFLPGMAALYSKECLLVINGYNEKLQLEDWEIYLKILKEYKVLYFDDVLAKYRWHETNSVKLISNSLVMNQTMIVLGEKKYCYEKGYEKEWNRIYNKCLLDHLYIKNYRSFIKFFLKYSKLSFLKYIIIRYVFLIKER